MEPKLALSAKARETRKRKSVGGRRNPLSCNQDGGSRSALRTSSLEFRNQIRQSSRLFIRGEVTARQPLDLEAELAQSFLREVDLSMFKGIFIAASHQERELIAISLEELVKVEPIALGFVIRHEACCGGEVEQAIVTIQDAMKLVEFGVRYLIALGPHLPDSRHPLEDREGTAQAPAGPVGETAQHRRRVPRVGVPVREEPAIEDEDSAYVRSVRGFAPLRALNSTSQVLQNDQGGKIESGQRRRPDTEIAPDRFDQIGTLGGRIRIVFRLVAVTHANVLDEKLGYLGGVRQVQENLGPSK